MVTMPLGLNSLQSPQFKFKFSSQSLIIITIKTQKNGQLGKICVIHFRYFLSIYPRQDSFWMSHFVKRFFNWPCTVSPWQSSISSFINRFLFDSRIHATSKDGFFDRAWNYFNFVLFLDLKCLKMGRLDVKLGQRPGGQVSSGQTVSDGQMV